MRLTNVMMANTSLMHINRNMRNLDRIIRSIDTGKRIQRPSDDPIIASRALLFRTSVHENSQFQRNVDQGMAWMNVTESTFNNINRELLFEMRNLAVQGANMDNNLENMQAIIRQMNSLFTQIGHEMNQTFGGNYLFSGFRTDEPPVFTATNNRSFVITQHFSLTDISREASFQRLVVEGNLGVPVPVTHNINVIKLAYTGLDTVPVVPGFEVVEVSVNDHHAYLPDANNGATPPVPILHFVRETGELVMHSDTAASFPREGISVTYQKTGFTQGDINPMVYFTGREILNTSTAHIPPGTQLVYNITQYFNRAASTGSTVMGGVSMLQFELAHTPYTYRNDFDALRDNLPPGAVITGNTVNIPAHLFETRSNISVTYAVSLDSPMISLNPNELPIHIKQDTRVAGVELVRATNLDGIALPLSQIEVNPSFNMHNQDIQYEFSTRTLISVNSLAKNVLTDKMFADFRRFFEFADSLHISNRGDLEQYFRNLGYSEEAIARDVAEQLQREGQKATTALHKVFDNMLFLIDRHAENSTREQTMLGARMVRLELVQNRLEQDEVSYNQLTSDNEDTDLIHATIRRMSAEALFTASIMANANVIQMSLANFLR
ncbi:MAG: hypothetical protein FWB96_12650 [Defluviitaleaceae bacterium]|nr:hypothetical protein [Defluviitaleaceae bacterium]MCL2263990.1 hypothetical protein [Defluviitaleaceae bacterium]